jgi:hypothetical protein
VYSAIGWDGNPHYSVYVSGKELTGDGLFWISDEEEEEKIVPVSEENLGQVSNYGSCFESAVLPDSAL